MTIDESWMLDAGNRILDAGYPMRVVGCTLRGAGLDGREQRALRIG